MTTKRKVYLGDSVYAAFEDGYHIVLTTENGMGPSNTIYLEPEVIDALGRFIDAIRARQAAAAPQDGPPSDAATATGMYDPE